MDVTNENKQEYVEGMIHFSMSGKFKHQLDAFLKGFYEIVPKPEVSCFSVAELKLLMNGREEIVVSTLAASSRYDGGLDEGSDIVVWLWKVVEKMSKDNKTKRKGWEDKAKGKESNKYKKEESNGRQEGNITKTRHQ